MASRVVDYYASEENVEVLESVPVLIDELTALPHPACSQSPSNARTTSASSRSIDVFTGNRPPRRARETYDQQRCLSYANLDAPMHPALSASGVSGQHPDDYLPIIMVINATSLTKPNAMQLMEADMKASCVNVVVVTES